MYDKLYKTTNDKAPDKTIRINTTLFNDLSILFTLLIVWLTDIILIISSFLSNCFDSFSSFFKLSIFK